jgi:membrane-bound lytic murein transglycosylase D
MKLRISVIFCVFCFFTGGIATAQPSGKDSTFIRDNPILERLDSLAAYTFFTNRDFTSERNILNKYGFPADSVPEYPDSVYRERIAALNLSSPFEFVYNDHVRSYIDAYSTRKRKLTARMLGLAEFYFPLFEEQLDKHGLPLELKYLAIIESALNPVARSRAGATGLWQFMLNTGKLYDLKVTSYVDDRSDPYKSTVAACEHMRDLYNIYGDWALVLAAYNAGSGSVNRAIRNAGLDSGATVTYWRIKDFLPKETQNYVPGFIGITYAMTYATEHNIYPVRPDFFHSDIDTLVLTQVVSFQQISSYLCIPYETVKFLNPAYKKGIIPASPQTPYVLVLPREYMADFINNHKAIAAYKTTEQLKTEQALAQAAQNKTTTQQPKVSQPAPKSNNNVKPGNYNKIVYYTVQKGDSLWSIASRYKATVDEIRQLNNLNNSSKLMPGQKLKIGIKG